eukprot:CAMPEP_0175198450 /NCGR_PEP_ID=MMETSP0093-20121207/8533_1 /TAXON_ID=311494 /ORGANISM="Alexandrium monilatum, Strain CCMP3105" /LENGTH=57 /DNA_ID=CAMNT_0016491443 /DNA_START=141 /DNA_END=314 /DNA_ORIENTATION=-
MENACGCAVMWSRGTPSSEGTYTSSKYRDNPAAVSLRHKEHKTDWSSPATPCLEVDL